MWSGYKFSAFAEASPIVLLLLGFSIAYYLLSKNRMIGIRLAVSSHCLFFIMGELFAVAASDYYVRGHYENGEMVHTQIGSILSYTLLGIFILGLISMIYSFRKFEGNKWIHILLLPILLSAGLMYFYAGMTLTHDWL